MRFAIVGVILVVILTVVIVLLNIRVTKVICITQYGICPDYLQNRLPNLLGAKWVDSVSIDQLTKSFDNIPEVKKITVEKKIPGIININISLRKALGVVYSFVNRAQVVVDEEGWLFEIKDMSNLPRLVVDTPLEIGNKLGNLELTAVNDLYLGSTILGQNLNAKIVNTALEIQTDKDLLIVISLDQRDSDWKVSLQAILRRSKIDGRVPHKIDLRFEDPVVVY